MKTKITQKEYLELMGLCALASRYEKMMQELIDVADRILDEQDRYGHGNDLIRCYSDDLDNWLKRLKIKVEK